MFSLLLVAFAGFLIYRLYDLQIVKFAENAEKAAGQHYRKVAEMPDRGKIYDSNGIELAGTTYIYQIGMTPKDVRSLTKSITRDEISAEVARLLELDPEAVTKQFQDTESVYVQLKKDVARDQAMTLIAYLSEQDIGGFAIDSEPRRFYTNGDLASQILGYTRYDLGNLVGQLGLEMQYNSLLTGSPGYTYVETDNYKNKGELPFSVPTSLQAKDGLNLQLTLDINIQRIAQQELADAIRVNDIKDGGSVIVMDPFTGAILAMASYPYFSSQDPTASPETQSDLTWTGSSQEDIDYLSSTVWRNRAISDTYEPGSTFKSITSAIALEENLTHENELFSDSPMYVLGQEIHCYTIVGHGTESLNDAFWHSCNPIFAQLSQRIGVTRYYDYIRAFGFREPTGIDLPAEEAGQIHEKPTELDMATLSYGESANITPIQLATAYSAFANGGNLVKPHLVHSTTDASGVVVREYQPETVRKVISEQTSTRVREMLKGVVTFGTGSKSYVEGYTVAGKTSTSTDEAGDHTLSFVGIAPADSPKLLALVVLNKPEDKKMTSTVAARTCGRIISQSLEYLGQARNYSDNDVTRLSKLNEVPDLTGMTLAVARKELVKVGLNLEAGDTGMGEQTIILTQYPAAKTGLHPNGIVFGYPAEQLPVDLVVVPDFSQKTVNECLSAAALSGLNIRIEGDGLGTAYSQSPEPSIKNRTAVTPETTESPENTDDTAETTTTEATTVPTETTAPTTLDDSTAQLIDGKLPRGGIVSIWFAAAEE
ncbi:MAG: penicillin-binding transpeptidase domain-containing protein [Eubacteriales bacterium]|nr:penicillin-binding transpeptidase domain-containing protein [Eubacteriales bacterium]